MELKAVSKTTQNLYIISELLEGGDLATYLASEKPLELSLLLQIAIDIAKVASFCIISFLLFELTNQLGNAIFAFCGSTNSSSRFKITKRLGEYRLNKI